MNGKGQKYITIEILLTNDQTILEMRWDRRRKGQINKKKRRLNQKTGIKRKNGDKLGEEKKIQELPKKNPKQFLHQFLFFTHNLSQ